MLSEKKKNKAGKIKKIPKITKKHKKMSNMFFGCLNIIINASVIRERVFVSTIVDKAKVEENK